MFVENPSSLRKFFIRFLTAFIPSRHLRHYLRHTFFHIGPYHYITFAKNYLLNEKKQQEQGFPHYLSIAACCKDEGDYMEEWVEYYLLQGVEHFYLYNNNGTDNSKEILQKYIEEGLIDWIEWPGKQQQIPIYKNAVEKFKNETRWMAIVDLDEFIVPMNGQKLSEALKHFEHFHQILIPWVIYGSSGHTKKTEGLVIERFTWRQKGIHSLTKPVVNLRAVFGPFVHDCCVLGRTLNFSEDKGYPRMVVNHYAVKSAEEYEAKKKRGDVFYKVSPLNDAYFQRNDLNEVNDDKLMLEYVRAIKEKLRERERERERERTS